MSTTLSFDTHRYLGSGNADRNSPNPALSGQYDLHPFQSLTLAGANAADVGMVQIGAGTRSPAEGMRTSAKHEIAYVVSGRARVDTVDGNRIVSAGDVLVSSPTELHATTALVDTVIFYVLIDPGHSPKLLPS